MPSVNETFAILGALTLMYLWLEIFDRTGRTMGMITGITPRFGPDGEDVSVAEVSFTVDGRYYSFLPTAVLRRYTREGCIGMQVPVAYNRDNPDDADVASPFRLYLPPIAVTLLYAAFIYLYMTKRLWSLAT